YGGSDIGELHKIGALLKGKSAEDDEAWFDACVKVAEGVRAHAQKFDQNQHRFSAAHAYLRACNYYQMAERFRTPKDKKALDAFRTGVECFHRHAELTDVKIDIVEVPFKDGSLPGYFVHAQNTVAERKPCVVFFDGLDVTGSACLDWLERRADVDAKKVGIVAISLGGYYSPRCAAMDPRYAACIAWGAQWDYHATWKKRIDAQFKTSLSVPGHHITW